MRNPTGAGIHIVLTRALEACTKMPKTDHTNCTPNIPQGNRQAQKKGPSGGLKLLAKHTLAIAGVHEAEVAWQAGLNPVSSPHWERPSAAHCG